MMIEQIELLPATQPKPETGRLFAPLTGSETWRGKRKWLAQYNWQKGLCAICGQHFPPALMTRDHIVPRSKGGGTDWDNIHLTCEPCNSAKGDSLPLVGFRKCNTCNERVTYQRHATCKLDDCPRTYITLMSVPAESQNQQKEK
jgi:hypothetical protein